MAHCGVRVTEFPLTPVRLLELLTQAEARAAAPTDSGEFVDGVH
ncbi:dehydrogenase/oxidase [Bordetella pertussis]|nr:dehydrogenase/oxidase [Bordetella pertussis]CPO07255.1 dehydrogenase/oxidase [Bordetella pertussis]